MNKKGQAAMEFLLTYGWAILVVLLVISALVYFGVLSPRQFLPTRCVVDSPLYCADKQISGTGTDGLVKVLLDNGNQNAISFVGKTATITDAEALIASCNVAQFRDKTDTNTITVAPSGSQFLVKFDGCTMNANKGQKVKLDVAIDYKDSATGFDHSSTGEILAEVE